MSSGIPVQREVAYLGALKEGLVIREQVFLDHREALEVVRLPA